MPLSPASSSGSGGGGPTALSNLVLAAPAASIDTGAAGIAAGYTALLIYLKVRSTIAGNQDGVILTWNADAGSHYAHTLQNTRSTVGASSDTGGYVAPPQALACSGSTSPANEFLHATIDVFRYADAVPHFMPMTGGYDLDGTNFQVLLGVLAYNQAAALSRLKVTCAGGNVDTGSRLTVYGIT